MNKSAGMVSKSKRMVTVVPDGWHVAMRQFPGQSSPSSLLPSSHVSPPPRSTNPSPQPVAVTGVFVAQVPGVTDVRVGVAVAVTNGGVLDVEVGVGLAPAVRVIVAVPPGPQPLRALLTAVISSLISTSPLSLASNAAQFSSDSVPSEMLTPWMSSLMPTSLLASQSPTHCA